ncbi:helix-turn-helix transcriptional regulator [bacterium]|nr:helix-turn-helix transcriptional regulator [bacterium]
MNRIRYYRTRLGLSQMQLAHQLGVSRQSVGDWETGRRFPSARLRDQLQIIFSKAPDLLSRTDDLPASEYRRVGRLEAWPRSPDNREVWSRGRHRYRELLNRLPNSQLPEQFESSTRCDSLLEVLAWLLLVTLGARPRFASPYRLGFYQHPILDAFNGSAGARLMPCLHLCRDGLELFLFPQVRLRPQDRIYIVDALMLIVQQRGRCWLALELDGRGHDCERDEAQKSQTNLPIVRIDGKKVTAQQFWPELQAQILKETS